MRIVDFLIVLLAFCAINNTLYGQKLIEKPISSVDYLAILNNSKDSIYVEILKEFDDYLAEYPYDFQVSIEKCKVIEQAYYDTYEDYNPKYDEFNICLNDLVRDFPNNQDVLLFKLKNTYGDSAIEFCNEIISKNVKNPGQWPDYKLSKFYEELARQYSYKQECDKVIWNSEIAEALNDTLDLSLLLAQQYMTLNNYEKTKNHLLRSLDSTDNSWESVSKGELLLKLGEPEKALEAFKYAQRDTSIWMDNGLIASALIENGVFDEARSFLIKDLNDSYNSNTTLHQLFVFDFKHSTADTTLSTYIRLNSAGFLNDAFGKYRLMMLFREPLGGWESTDLVKLSVFIFTVLILLILPYLWILPLHYISNHFNISNGHPSLTGARWGLRDLWMVSSFVLLIEFVALLLFNYVGLLSTFLDDLYIEEAVHISLNKANFGLFFFSGMLMIVLIFLKKQDYQFLNAKKWSTLKGIAIGFGLAFLFRVIYFYMVRLGMMPQDNSSIIGSVQDYFSSINSYYHPALSFLFFVVLVPFYEEYLFRGIALIAIEKRIKFIGANIVQAIIFTLLHGNLHLFFFYFSFGLIAGILVRKSESIAPSIAFHMTNNFFAFIVLTRLS